MLSTYRHAMPFGAELLHTGGVRFRLNAARARDVALIYRTPSGERTVPLVRTLDGWYESTQPHLGAGTRYGFIVDGLQVPDPAARFAPDGVHGLSVVVDPDAYVWPQIAAPRRPWHEHVIYELHVGTFTPEGTYVAAQRKLSSLAELGVTTVELMPLAEVPGTRNWGYDGVLPYAPTRNYGTPDELKAFVADAHAHGLAVLLDVVYNHFGPEGNYLHAYASEFYTAKYHTPWGSAIALEDPQNAAVRAFFIENAIFWLEEYRFDGLRLDAVHAIYDGKERSFLRELARTVHARLDRDVHLVIENDDNESTLLEAGYRAQWNDDAHHAAHVAVTGQRDGYYSDYASQPVALLGRTLTQGFAFQGEASPYRGDRRRGEPSSHLPLDAFVTFLQNHDQIGNSPFGERITSLAPENAIRAIAAVLLLAPPVPLIFMGEEWAASTPFLFFCDFEPELAAKVTAGRRTEFAAFERFADPANRERIPDPSAPETFSASKLRWAERDGEPHASWLRYYTQLLAIRAKAIAPRTAGVRGERADYETIGNSGLRAHWRLDDGALLGLEANLGPEAAAGFTARPQGDVVFASHDAVFEDSIAPPWSVRWTVD